MSYSEIFSVFRSHFHPSPPSRFPSIHSSLIKVTCHHCFIYTISQFHSYSSKFPSSFPTLCFLFIHFNFRQSLAIIALFKHLSNFIKIFLLFTMGLLKVHFNILLNHLTSTFCLYLLLFLCNLHSVGIHICDFSYRLFSLFFPFSFYHSSVLNFRFLFSTLVLRSFVKSHRECLSNTTIQSFIVLLYNCFNLQHI